MKDTGLARVVGPWGLTANLFNGVVGAGIFVLPAALARLVGPAAALTYLACVLVMGAVAFCFAAASSRVAKSGGPYAFCLVAFGPFTGFLVGVLVWLGAVLGAAGVASAIAEAVGHIVPMLSTPVCRSLLILVMFATLAAINTAGIRSGMRVVNILTIAKLVPLAIFIAVGLAHVEPANLLPRSTVAPGGFGHAILLGIYAFAGMETALGVSGEVRDPARNIPRALLGVMAGVTLLYVLIQIVAQGILGEGLSGSISPLSDAMARISPALGGLLLLGAGLSMIGYLSGDAMSAPRLLYAFAADGMAPAVLARVRPATQAPWVAILVHAGIAAALALTSAYEKLLILSALTSVGVYIIGCAAAVILQRRNVSQSGTPLHFQILPFAAGIGIIAMLVIGALAQPAELGGLAATILVTAAIYTLSRRQRAHRPSQEDEAARII